VKEQFVTIFDSLFLPQGIVLSKSLYKNNPNCILWVICADELSYEILRKLNLINLKLIKLSDYETPELLKVKQERTIAEYLWTLTPFASKFVFNSDKTINKVTYIDADLYILDNLDSIFNEFASSNKSVMITKHGYNPIYDQSSLTGKFCVQFMIFIRHNSENVRNWWEQECLKWCYARYEDGKFGDQKYLDSFPHLFKNDVHILTRENEILAPWNVQIYPYSDAKIYHFHGFRIINKNKFTFGRYPIPIPTLNNIHKNYITEIKAAINLLLLNDFIIKPQINDYTVYDKIKFIIQSLRSKIWNYNFINTYENL